MVIKYNVTGTDRKRLVTALSKLTGVKAKYLGMPSMAYSAAWDSKHKVILEKGKSSRVLFTMQEMQDGGEPF
ncbi:hypothetical protein Q1X24_16195 [Enterococcus sp. B1E4]|uniref:hypothetical protein n=1 Tax=unclassified Enterococcus TaxID=2608891 RepID=UPI00265BA0D6|nr:MULTISPECIES: hypothetical protein [unclassified Enterococcus]MDO0896393.1 hypothetical protein [Enterococcus sp. B1E4]MDO0909159.1 hypothetical protein [Enterococcus sp. B2E4]